MKRCPDCGTAFIHGGEFCSMDGAQLVAVQLPVLTGVVPPAEEVEEGHNPTLVGGTEPRREPRPTGPVAENTTGAIGAGAVTLALSLGDTAFIGAVFAERYKLEALIGRGGMGVVYRARHLLLERPVAVKLLRPQYLSDDRAVKRFMREAQAMARVEHPNTVTIHDFGLMPDGGAYLVMEFIEGETLRSVLGRVGSLPVADAVAITEQICGAVDAAHRQGVVHRDLKPENIMFKRTDEGSAIKVVDFGLAKVLDAEGADGKPALTSAGDLFGTPAYMAPEFFEGEEVGRGADVYSIGILTYEMLTGAPPFQGSVQSIMSGHLFKEPPTIDETGIPEAVDRVLKTALRKRSAERFASASDFAARLSGALAGEAYEEPASPSGALPALAALDSLGGVAAEEVAPDEAPTFVGDASPDDMETIGGPQRRIPTADLVAPVDTLDTIETVVPAPPRRRALVATAAVLGAVVLGSAFVVALWPPSGTPVSAVTPPERPEMQAPPPVAAVAPAPAAPDESGRRVVEPAPPDAGGPKPSRPAAAPQPKTDRAPSAAPPPAKAEEKKPDATKADDKKPDAKKKKRKWYNPFSW